MDYSILALLLVILLLAIIIGLALKEYLMYWKKPKHTKESAKAIINRLNQIEKKLK